MNEINQNLINEWHDTKNGKLIPENFSAYSNKKVWWKCNKGHEWQAVINNRSKGSNCPYCSGRKATSETCLENTNPKLTKEWHPSKNGNLTPRDFSSYSHKKVWWLCSKGHEWQATIKNRSYNRNCPTCNSSSQTSFQQVAIFYYLLKIFPNAKHRENLLIDNIQAEADIYINGDDSIKRKPIAIEYSGYFSHRDKFKKDIEKSNILSNHGIFITIRELGLPKLEAKNFKVIEMKKSSDSTTELDRVIKELLTYLLDINCISPCDYYIDINVKKDTDSIYKLMNFIEMEKSLASTIPDLLAIWNKKNTIKPNEITSHSGKIVWWLCQNGHEWQAAVYHVTNGTSCPYCAGKKVSIDNCLATLKPELVKEWHYKKNGALTPSNVTTGSGKNVWWKCSRDHEWQDSISHRTSGRDCPYCSGRRVSNDNCLALLNPKLSTEWNYDKNKDLTPESSSIYSNKKVWWKCSKGHEWQAIISSRASGNNCPYCAGKKVCIDNCLATLNPKLAKEWHPTRNNTLTPFDVTPGSHKKVYWQCSKGHKWQAEVKSRNRGCRCPYCINHYTTKKSTNYTI